MEENIDLAVPERPAPPSEWFNIWKEVFTKPSVHTYRWIARQADVKTAYIWLVLGWLAMSVSILGLTLLLGNYGNSDYGPVSMSMFVFGGLLVIVVGAVLEIALASIVAALTNIAARALGGSGDFRELIYCFAAYFVPVLIVSSIVASLSLALPGLSAVFSLLDMALTFYAAVLHVNAIKAVHYLKTGQAILASLALVVLILVVAFLVGAIAPLLSPTIGDVFSNMIVGLKASPRF
jgi:hypothetical protein